MVEPTPLQNAATHNERSLSTLIRAIRLSQGQFSFVLVRCNYLTLQRRTIERLRQICPEELQEIQEIVLPENVRTLYSTIQEKLGSQQPAAVMVMGLESTIALDDLLASTNNMRDEFRKRLPFPMVLWIDDRILHKLWRFAPDFASWAATPIKFEMAKDELLNFLQLETDYLFASILNPQSCSLPKNNVAPGLIRIGNRTELDLALQDLENSGVSLSPELDASVRFVLGQEDYSNDRIDAALAHYERSLTFWKNSHRLDRQGVVLLNIGLCYCRKADLNLGDNRSCWQRSRFYLQQCVDIFTQAGREDLVAQSMGQLAEVLQQLQAWEELQTVAQASIALHKKHGSLMQLAQDYGFLAEVAVEQARWEPARDYAQRSLAYLSDASDDRPPHDRCFPLLLAQRYRLLLAKAQNHLGAMQEAAKHVKQAAEELETAIESSEHQYDPQGYIRTLKALRSLYFEQGYYREAFHIKLTRHSLEQQYRFRAFIGADRLQPQRAANNLAWETIPQHGTVALEIAASGRQKDIDCLLERISRADCKLTVIHGQSGVGKSSTVTAGLVPALHNQAIGDQIAVPVVLQVYTDWVRELGKSFAEALEQVQPFKFEPQPLLNAASLNSVEAIVQQLHVNAQNYLMSILIFDQLEEFFFGLENRKSRQQFDLFLKQCLEIPYTKVILCIREDYLYWLFKLENLNNSEIIRENILDSNIRYQFTNFSIEDTKSVIYKLTEQSQFHLEPVLIDKLVHDLAGEEGEVRPIELQVVGAQLQTESITKLVEYQEYGPKSKLIERYVKEVIKDCGPENEQAAQLVLYLLTDENNTRPFKTRAELASELAEFDNTKKLDLILEILVKSGLVVLFPELPGVRYQLVHDYLVDFIRYFQQHESGLQAQLKQLRQKEQQSRMELDRLRAELKQQALQAERADIPLLPLQTGLNLWEQLKALRQREELTQSELDRLRAELKQKELQNQLTESKEKQRSSEARLNRFLKIALASSVTTIFALTFLAVSAVFQRKEAVIKEIQAHSISSEALFASNQQIGALKQGLLAGKQFKEAVLDTTKDRTENQVLTALQQAAYWITERNRLQGHNQGVTSVTFSPDGETIASASSDKTIKLWRRDGKELETLEKMRHDDRINRVVWAPDGEKLASASSDKTVKLWRRDGTLIRTLTGHRDQINSVAWSPDGQLIASASSDTTIKLWHPDGTLVTTLAGDGDPVTSLTFSPDSQKIASTQNKTIKIWSLNGRLLQTLRGHSDAVLDVAWSPDGQWIASASMDRTIALWRSDGSHNKTLYGHTNVVTSVTFSPDSQMIVSGSAEENTLKLWRLDSTLLTTFTGHSSWVTSVSFSPDGQLIASSSRDKTIALWHRDRPWFTTLQHDKWVTSVAFSPDDELIATASQDRTVKLWRRDGTLLHTLQGHSDEVWAVSFSPDSQVIATASKDKTIQLYRRDSMLLHILEGHTDLVFSVSWSPDGELLASASKDNTVKLWSKKGELLKTLYGHTQSVNWVTFSRDGELIASASDDKTVKIWNRDGTLLHTLKGHTNSVYSVSFSPDSQTIASASIDNKLILWSREGEQREILSGNGDWFTSVSFSPNGKLIASAMDDRSLKLWRRDGTQFITLKGYSHKFTTISFSADGQTIAAGSEQGKVILWKMTDLELDTLLKRGCDWLHDYLKTNPKVSDSDRAICDDIHTEP